MYRGILFFGLLLMAASLPAADAEPAPLDVYGSLPLFSDAELSPDGSRVAAIANTRSDSRMMVLSRDGQLIRQIAVESIKPRGVAFYDNDHLLAFVSDTKSLFGLRGKLEFSGAYSVNLTEGAPVPLLYKTKDLFPAQSGLGRIIGRGGKSGTVLMPAYIGSIYQTPSLDLLEVNLKSGRGASKLKGTTDTIDWFSDGKGGVLARERYNNETDTYQFQIRDGGWKTIFERKKVSIPPLAITGVMPDGSGFAFVDAHDEDYFDGLMVLGLDGKVTGPVLQKPGHDIDAVYLDDERRILGVRYSGMQPDYEFLDAGLKESYAAMMAALPNAMLYLDSWSDDRKTVLYSVFDPDLGEAWLVQDMTTGRLQLLARDRERLPAAQTAIPIAIEYKARDGLMIPAVVTLPPGASIDDNLKLPLVVMPHGGPASYDRLDFDWMAQFVASRGYVVLQPNFRGSAGFGKAFLDAGRGEWGGKMQDDLTDGMAALDLAGIANKDRACIVGASYGGYAALAGAAFTPDVYKCSIAIAPVSDLNAMLQESRQKYGRDHWVISYWERAMADGDARRKKLQAISPVNAASQVNVPVLLIHGSDDTVVPISQSEQMDRALRAARKPVEFVRLKGEDHWLSIADTRLQLLAEVDRFLKTHLPAD
ncbi:MAG TPA: prolyl oligopeptidase family serine peptidase [Hyphomonas sp.]|nr:prolyl oligopeptidase family serine peptidase [Hyphomonas sp.]